MDNGLKTTLEACQKVAGKGYEVAQKNNLSLKRIISSSGKKLDTIKADLLQQQKEIKIPEYCQSFINQTEEKLKDLNSLQKSVEAELSDKKGTLSLFNVVVYGRTKAGKSTLMEVLTRGDGATIGKGAQRTTKDVRSYEWNGLTIYDTPGIAASAVDGRLDEEKAYKVAQYADLLIFLFSDDAPQKEEAVAFAKLKQLGKPILGIINVKSSSSDRTFSKMRLRDIRKKLDNSRLDKIKSQLLQLATSGGGQWDDTKFIYTDLHTAFLSQMQDVKELVEHAKELYDLSRFHHVESSVVAEIQQKGTFFMFKNFIDIIYQLSWKTECQLYEHAKNGTVVFETFKQGEKTLQKIKERFEKEANERVDIFLSNLERELRNTASAFANENYENKYANDDWRYTLERMHIQESAQTLVEGLAFDCENYLNEFSKEFKQNLRFNLDVSVNGIDGKKIFDTLGNVKLALGIGGLAFAGAVLLGLIEMSNPIGLGIVILKFTVGWLFKDKEKKIREAINKMRNALNANIDKIIVTLRRNLRDVLEKQIIDGYLNASIKHFESIMFNIKRFIDLQKEMAGKINNELLVMNRQLLHEAAEHLNVPQLETNTVRMARVPGEAVLLEVKRDKLSVCEAFNSVLHELLQEEVLCVSEKLSIVDLASEIFLVDKNIIRRYDEKQEIFLDCDIRQIRNPERIKRFNSLFEQLTGYTLNFVGDLPEAIPVSEVVPSEKTEGFNVGENPYAEKVRLPWYRQDADLEDPLIQWDVAQHYATGTNVEQNLAEAFKWAKQSAENGHVPEAQSYLGDCYYFGLGIVKDVNEAFEWYSFAADSNYVPAYKYLADCYYFGEGTAADFEKAAYYYQLSAENGNVEAMFNYGNAFYFGEGREQDFVTAVKWYRQAIEYDQAGAQNNLGNCCYIGNGIKQNYEAARILYKYAVQNGCIEAQENLKNFNYEEART